MFEVAGGCAGQFLFLNGREKVLGSRVSRLKRFREYDLSEGVGLVCKYAMQSFERGVNERD